MKKQTKQTNSFHHKAIIHTAFAVTAMLLSLQSTHAENTSQPAQQVNTATPTTPQEQNTTSSAQDKTAAATALAPTYKKNVAKPVIAEQTWLGVTLANVPPVLSMQLANIIPSGQGVMLQSVAANSPAAKAGLQPYDVIISMADQKLYSPKQLAELVRHSKPEKTVLMKVVRQGQLEEINVTLGKHAIPAYSQHPHNTGLGWGLGWPQMNHSMRPMMPLQRMAPAMPPQGNDINNHSANNLAWDSFESVQVRTLEDGRYHAEVIYKDEKGKVKHFTFEGKQDEISQQINKQEELPTEKKQALLNALNMQPSSLMNNQLFNQHFFSQPFFLQPLFGGNPFNDPFFQQGYPVTPKTPMTPKTNSLQNPFSGFTKPSGNIL